jgi:hypothetical protein
MKTGAITGAVLAALAAGALATPSFARDPCQQRKHNNGTAGAVIGGIAGAVLGNNVARGGGRTGGTIIGGVAGAAIGNSVGRSGTKCEGYAYYNPNSGYYDRDGRWHSYSANTYYNGGYNGQYGYNNGYYAGQYGSDTSSYNRGYYDSYGNWHYYSTPY